MKQDTKESKLLKFLIISITTLLIHLISMIFVATTIICYALGSKAFFISLGMGILYYLLSFLYFIKFSRREN